jgi:hypothetical protein
VQKYKMHPYKVRFIDSSYQSSIKNADSLGKIDGIDSANNLEAFLAEEYDNGYELHSIVPVNANTAGKITYPNSVTIGYQVCLKRIKD